MASVPAAVNALDWAHIASELDAQGVAVIGPVLTRQQCEELGARLGRACTTVTSRTVIR
jgi:hypothetical protein